MTDIGLRPDLAPLDPSAGDHDKFAHVVSPARLVTEALVTGSAVTAVCGHTWVPTRAPEQFPVCPDCKRIMAELGHNL